MKKLDYLKELVEAGKLSDNASDKDFTYEELKGLYKEMRKEEELVKEINVKGEEVIDGKKDNIEVISGYLDKDTSREPDTKLEEDSPKAPDYLKEGKEQTAVLNEMQAKSEALPKDVKQIGTSDWKLISMVLIRLDNYRHVVKAMEYNGGVIMQFTESYGSSLSVSTLNLPGHRLIKDTDDTWKLQ